MGYELTTKPIRPSLACTLRQLLLRLLEPQLREAVDGDLIETRETEWRSFFSVLNLVFRQHIEPWRDWRPWLAAFGLAVPFSFALMGFSVSLSQSYLRILNPLLSQAVGLEIRAGFVVLLCNALLLAAWSWTGGFVVGSVSRRTLWVSAVLSFLPCFFCLSRFRIESLSRLCLLLFLPPAIWGVRQGLRIAQIKFSSAILLALAVTVLTIPLWTTSGRWIPNWALSWPAWYLVATSHKPDWLRFKTV